VDFIHKAQGKGQCFPALRFCSVYSREMKFLEWLNAGQIGRRTVLCEVTGEEKGILHFKILTAG